MKTKRKSGMSTRPTVGHEQQIATAREVMKRREAALMELAEGIMREDREILRKLAE